jgi:transcription antitermination factor NusG
MSSNGQESSDLLHTLRWYAVHLHSNFEALVSDMLSRTLEGEVFYPFYFVRSSRRGKEHTIKKPLFPGYLFVKTTLEQRNKVGILSTRGVVGMVRSGRRYLPIEEEVIRSLKILNEHKEGIAPHPYIREGSRVRVKGGPLAGARGIVLRARGKKPRLIVSVHILQRSVSAVIDSLYLEPDI